MRKREDTVGIPTMTGTFRYVGTMSGTFRYIGGDEDEENANFGTFRYIPTEDEETSSIPGTSLDTDTFKVEKEVSKMTTADSETKLENRPRSVSPCKSHCGVSFFFSVNNQ